MTAAERSLLERLDKSVRREQGRIRPIIERVRAELAQKPDALMTWEPILLEFFSDALPAEIRSAWVFVLRADADTGAERHPNSHQRMMTFEGVGDMRTENQKSDGEIQWRSNILVSDQDAPLEQRWISIPRNVWHRPVIPKGGDWVVVSFHTVPAEELIEERPRSGHGGETKQMLYLGSTPEG
jgi:hypothetical protein